MVTVTIKEGKLKEKTYSMQFIFVGCVHRVQDVCLRVAAILHTETLCHSILTGTKITRLDKCINVEAEIFDPTRKIETIYCMFLFLSGILFWSKRIKILQNLG